MLKQGAMFCIVLCNSCGSGVHWQGTVRNFHGSGIRSLRPSQLLDRAGRAVTACRSREVPLEPQRQTAQLRLGCDFALIDQSLQGDGPSRAESGAYAQRRRHQLPGSLNMSTVWSLAEDAVLSSAGTGGMVISEEHSARDGLAERWLSSLAVKTVKSLALLTFLWIERKCSEVKKILPHNSFYYRRRNSGRL